MMLMMIYETRYAIVFFFRGSHFSPRFFFFLLLFCRIALSGNNGTQHGSKRFTVWFSARPCAVTLDHDTRQLARSPWIQSGIFSLYLLAGREYGSLFRWCISLPSWRLSFVYAALRGGL
jgi:hypothetical protein